MLAYLSVRLLAASLELQGCTRPLECMLFAYASGKGSLSSVASVLPRHQLSHLNAAVGASLVPAPEENPALQLQRSNRVQLPRLKPTGRQTGKGWLDWAECARSRAGLLVGEWQRPMLGGCGMSLREGNLSNLINPRGFTAARSV